jgi:hypothetical protein
VEQNEQNEERVRLIITKGHKIRPFQIEGEQRQSSRRNSASDVGSPISPPIEKFAFSPPKSSAVPSQNGAPQGNLELPRLRVEDKPLEDRKQRPRGQYVTLSHRWGKAKFPQLTNDTLKDFQKGIALSSLPLTFRQAIKFARRLSPSIRYIWIDSLCIIQDDKDDWDYESVQMYSVYRNSYCNISATAASDSSQGLHFARNPQHLWEDEINLNTEGIPRPLDERIPKRFLGFEPLIRRCKIQDASFWDRQLDNAPINRRAWVLQERLLAPRVLHFCKDQIAWECSHIDAAESYPHGISHMELGASTVGERKRLKALMSGDYDSNIRALGRIDTAYAAHENWKRIVERYSATSLTNPKDKLIALAGIAELTSKRMDDRWEYVAGLWEKYLASQLLWYVEPKYQDEQFKYPQRRSDCWRAPSFSWAALDAPQGIKCAETVREENLEISVEEIHVKPMPPGFKFGAIESDCYIKLNCTLIEVQIGKTLGPAVEAIVDDGEEQTVRYNWKLPKINKLPIISNLYLDSPRDDFERIDKGGNIFCIRAHRRPTGQLICLLVQKCEGVQDQYRRIGLADVPEFWKDLKVISDARAPKKVIRLV